MTFMSDVCFAFFDAVGCVFVLFLHVFALIVSVPVLIGETSDKHDG
jgi:hypothetical protein